MNWPIGDGMYFACTQAVSFSSMISFSQWNDSACFMNGYAMGKIWIRGIEFIQDKHDWDELEKFTKLGIKGSSELKIGMLEIQELSKLEIQELS